jgi:hypothetical protein
VPTIVLRGRIAVRWWARLLRKLSPPYACWNLFDFTPEGRPQRDTPPQQFRSEFLERHYLDAK